MGTPFNSNPKDVFRLPIVTFPSKDVFKIVWNPEIESKE
jgi:hypothetical protein